MKPRSIIQPFALCFFALSTIIGCSAPDDRSPAPPKKEEVNQTNRSEQVQEQFSCTYQASQTERQLDCESMDSKVDISIQSTGSSPSISSEDYKCSFNINGEAFEGSSKTECDKLKEELGIDMPKDEQSSGNQAPSTPAPSDNVVQCNFNINGESFQGNSQEECDKLKKDLGIDTLFDDLLAQNPPAKQPSSGSEQTSNDVYRCQFNINGELYEGDSKEECDKLKKDLGLNF